MPGIIRGKLLKEVRHVAAGGLHSACVTADGQVYSWGSADDGSLGRQSDDPPGEVNAGLGQCTPTVVTGFVTLSGENQDGTMVALSAGDVHTIYLSAKGDVYMTGMYKDMDSGKFAHPLKPDGSPVGFRPTGDSHAAKGHLCHVWTILQCRHSPDSTMVTWGKSSFCY
jgi:regulator of chromosome condensation